MVRQNPAGVTRQSLGEDLLEGFVVLRFVENGRPGIASVQGVINPARFVCTFRSSRLGILSDLKSPKKSPDTFSSQDGASDLHFKEKSERQFRSVALLDSSGFGGEFVLVLVLVLETLLGYSVGSLYQSSEHRHDPF
jgi:hypothetical protein